MPHHLVFPASKSLKSITHQGLFKNVPMLQTVSNVNILLKLKYLRSWKAVLQRLVYFNKIVNSGRSTLMGFQMLQQNSEFSSNDSWMQCTSWMKELWNPFVCDADQHFDMKVKCPPRRPHFWVNFLIVWRETPVKCPGMPGGWAVLELNGKLPLLSWLKKKMFWFQSHWNNAIDAKTAGQFDSSIMMKWFALNFLVYSEQWMSCGRWKSAQQKVCASTSQLGLYLMNILIFVSSAW